MKFRLANVLALALALAALACGCSRGPRIKTSKVEFKSYEAGVLTFEARIRKGDTVCFEHGEGGTRGEITPEENQIVTITVSKVGDKHLELSGVGYSRIAVVSATLIEKPVLKDGKYHVADYIKSLGVAQSPNVPLYLYVKPKE